MVFTASLLGAQQNKDSVENKPASLLVDSLGKALNGMLQVVGLIFMWQTGSGAKHSTRRDDPSLTEDLQPDRGR